MEEIKRLTDASMATESVEQHARSEQSTLLLPRITADFQEHCLSQSQETAASHQSEEARQLSERETSSLGNSSSSISTLAGTGHAVSEWAVSGFEDGSTQAIHLVFKHVNAVPYIRSMTCEGEMK